MSIFAQFFKSRPTFKMAEEFVQGKISNKKVVVFSKSTCPYCSLAINVLSKYVGPVLKPEQFEVVEISANPNMNKIQDYFQELTGARTVPRVFINSKFVGGGTDIEKLDKTNKLQGLLAN